MSFASAPKAPSPGKTARRQLEYNVKAATRQNEMNMINSTNPYGTTTYTQVGTNEDGTPKYAVNQQLNPQQQALMDAQTAAGKTAATAQAGLLTQGMNQGAFDGSNAATEARLIELGRTRLDPIMQQQQAALESKLANQGITNGSAAWNNALDAQGRTSNDAYNQLLLNGNQQAFNQGLATWNAPYSALGAVNGAQGANPGAANLGVNTPQVNIAAPDITGLINQKYQAQNANYQNMMGGIGALAGMAGTAIGGPMGGAGAQGLFGLGMSAL